MCRLPFAHAWHEADFMRAANTDEAIARIAALPMFDQPGTHWHYSAAVDIQGYIVERLSGQTLADFMQTRIFAPLHMNDTAFYVWHRRRTVLYRVCSREVRHRRMESLTPEVAPFGIRTIAAGS
jgi:CubicO group peptidase (beta-lactamase class C family)